MPCYDPRDSQDVEDLKQRMQEATRAACELGKILYKNCPHCLPLITTTTIKWLKRHERLDKLRASKGKR